MDYHDECLSAIVQYCRENIEDFDEKAKDAYLESRTYLQPIECGNYYLANQIVECIYEWMAENDVDYCGDVTTLDVILSVV